MKVAIKNDGGILMKLTKEQKAYGVRISMAMVLLGDVLHHEYGIIQTLCEMFNLSNKKVVKQAKNFNRIILPIPSEQIFYDWAYVIYDESEYNEQILYEFCNMYKKRYPQIDTLFKELENYYSKNETEQCGYIFQKMLKWGMGTHGIMLFLCQSDVIEDFELVGANYKDYYNNATYALFASEKRQDEYLCEFNTGEQILTSPQFKKYLKARRTELAEYMSDLFGEEVTETNLGISFDNMLVSKASDQGVYLDYSLGGIINTACKSVLINHGGGMDWYEAITSRKGSTYACNLNYIPDVDDIIEKYYIQLLRFHYNREEDFSKVYLIRECKSESPLIDVISIMFMYNIDVFTKMFTNLLEDYYTNFSWEKIINQELSVRYESIIATLKNDIQSLKNNLERANTEIQIFNDQLRKEKDSEIIPLERATAEYEKKMEEKDKEIEKLRQQIRSRDEFIELLENADDGETSSTIDIHTLQTKRYLFVGYISEAMPELCRRFPNSLFMENENFSLTNIKVDAIVMLIKYMSHSMYYKIKSTNTLSSIPVAMCNTKNIGTVYDTMAKVIK